MNPSLSFLLTDQNLYKINSPKEEQQKFITLRKFRPYQVMVILHRQHEAIQENCRN